MLSAVCTLCSTLTYLSAGACLCSCAKTSAESQAFTLATSCLLKLSCRRQSALCGLPQPCSCKCNTRVHKRQVPGTPRRCDIRAICAEFKTPNSPGAALSNVQSHLQHPVSFTSNCTVQTRHTVWNAQAVDTPRLPDGADIANKGCIYVQATQNAGSALQLQLYKHDAASAADRWQTATLVAIGANSLQTDPDIVLTLSWPSGRTADVPLEYVQWRLKRDVDRLQQQPTAAPPATAFAPPPAPHTHGAASGVSDHAVPEARAGCASTTAGNPDDAVAAPRDTSHHTALPAAGHEHSNVQRDNGRKRVASGGAGKSQLAQKQAKLAVSGSSKAMYLKRCSVCEYAVQALTVFACFQQQPKVLRRAFCDS